MKKILMALTIILSLGLNFKSYSMDFSSDSSSSLDNDINNILNSQLFETENDNQIEIEKDDNDDLLELILNVSKTINSIKTRVNKELKSKNDISSAKNFHTQANIILEEEVKKASKNKNLLREQVINSEDLKSFLKSSAKVCVNQYTNNQLIQKYIADKQKLNKAQIEWHKKEEKLSKKNQLVLVNIYKELQNNSQNAFNHHNEEMERIRQDLKNKTGEILNQQVNNKKKKKNKNLNKFNNNQK